MNFWRGLEDRIERDVPLAPQTWFRLGGRARWQCRPRDEVELAAVVRRALESDVPLKVLGAGANVLVSDDGFDGVVVRLDSDAFRRVEPRGDGRRVGAGVDLMPFAKGCSREGRSGLECMAGIPATIGGAVRMNAGGRFGDFAGVVRGVRVLRRDGVTEDWSRERCGFGYRHSEIGDAIVLSVDLALPECDPATTRARFEECLAYKQRTQPLVENSAGCIFKNPPGASAGALIDRAGLKGTRCGAARVSERHANFVVADQGATASDVLRLIDVVRERVRREFATELELEIDVWRPERVKSETKKELLHHAGAQGE